jgi:hypothetical protein
VRLTVCVKDIAERIKKLKIASKTYSEHREQAFEAKVTKLYQKKKKTRDLQHT